MSTPAVEEYLELLYRLDADQQGVRPATIARQLGISTAAVAEMLVRLESEQLIHRTPDRSVRLADTGRRLGRAQVRKHRLVERLLHGILGRPWEAVHAEACRFEHVMTDEITESLDRALGQPATCPHGNPIPGPEADAEPLDGEPLAECRAGQVAEVISVLDEKTELLRYLLDLGLLPGAILHVEQVAPFGGPLMIRIGEARYALGRDVATKIVVRQVPFTGPVQEPRAERVASVRPAAS